jgi:hypothetical protein
MDPLCFDQNEMEAPNLRHQKARWLKSALSEPFLYRRPGLPHTYINMHCNEFAKMLHTHYVYHYVDVCLGGLSRVGV